MNLPAVLPVLIVATSMLVGLIIFALPEQRTGLRSTLNLTGAVVKLVLVIVMLLGVLRGQHYQSDLPLVPGIDLVLRVDPISLLFVTLSSVLWLLTTIYAIGYLEGSPHRSRFFGFFSLCVAATAGVALSGNLLTFLLFYELLTLATYPLVVHRGSETARRAGQVYLAYTLGGGVLLLIGTVWLYSLTGDVTFTLGGLGDSLQGQSSPALIMIFVLLIAGLGVKAALVPFHSWLPQAMVAPAPVSALLHAVAVVKAGAFGIVLVLYEIFGIEFAAELGVTTPLMVLAAITILYGSLRALSQDDLKRRLAFSTVSQVSYIALGVTILGPLAIVGGLVHLVHQGLMKVTLFFCAGNLAETLGIHKISDMDGVGRRMPWTMSAFTLSALGMIGVPPLAGFITKWYLGLGALQAEQGWVLLVLIGSSLLNAAYFLPVLQRAWFREPVGDWPRERHFGRKETAWLLLLPPLVTTAMAVGAGLFAAMPISPLQWVQFIVQGRGFIP
ncbi:complex I subunit 5 family protein [Thiohalophilus sp.]|uniref:complex I subunit 5 family protein n=1 Tax=Thiohalophilus sp. TaxID=3028392 RepID=UPI00397566EC